MAPGSRLDQRLDQRIDTERLALVSLSEAVLSATVEGHARRAQEALGGTVPPEWLALVLLAARQLTALTLDPGAGPWLSRAVILRSTGAVIGHAGFHGRPIAGERLELGYEIFPPYRRRGYALEAVKGLLQWAAARHAQTAFLVGIALDNQASFALAHRLGFFPAGRRRAEGGAEETLLELNLAAPVELRAKSPSP